MDKYYVGCGQYQDSNSSEYYIAETADGNVVKRGLLEDDAYAICAEMNLDDEIKNGFHE